MDHPAPEAEAPDGPALRLVTRRELAWAVLACSLAATLFLGPALFTGRILSPADLLYVYAPWQTVRPATWPGAVNGLLGDSALQFEPWLAYAAARLHAGALPLWIPGNMLGAPLLANMQTGLFSPLNWPYFLWPDPGMLVVRVWLKLVLAALGTYLLARQVLRVSPLPAVVAALTFAYGAFMIDWALHPHTAAAIWLPWVWWATGRLLEAPGPRRAAALAACVALLLLAGHPETAFQTMLVTGLLALVLVAHRRPWQAAGAVRDLAWWAGAAALGGAVAAIQILPFVEYSAISWAQLARTQFHIVEPHVPAQYAWTLFSPNWFGNPVQQTDWGPLQNYNETNNFAGVVPLLLAPLAFAGPEARARRGWAVFLAGLGALALAVVYQVPLLQKLVAAVPLLNLSQNQRLTFVAELALGLLGALGLEALLQAGARGSRGLRVALAVGGTALLGVGVGVPWGWAGSVFGVPAGDAAIQVLWQQNLWRTAGLLLAGTAIILAVWRWGGRRAALGFALLPVLLAGDLWQAHGDYLPTTARADYYPATPATTFLQSRPGLFRVVGINWALLPETNLMYGLQSLAGYDGLQPRPFRDLAAQLDPTRDMWPGVQPFHQVASPILNLLNARYVLVPAGIDPNVFPDVNPNVRATTRTGPIAGSARPGQTFVAQHDFLTSITVHGTTYGHTPTAPLVFHLRADPAGPDLVTQTLPIASLQDDQDWTVTFPPIAGSRGRSYDFYFDSPAADGAAAAGLWYNPGDAYPDGARQDEGQTAGGDLVFHTSATSDPAAPWFTRVLDGGAQGASVYENQEVLPRAWLAHQAQVLDTPKVVRTQLSDPGFDARGTALLSTPLPAADILSDTAAVTPTDTVTVTQYAPEAVAIRVQSAAAGILILSDETFPGWQATVDGTAAPILTVDYGLRGVYVPAGTHTVRFVYAPVSVQRGALISGAALLGILDLALGVPGLAWRRRRGRANRALDSPPHPPV